MHSENPTIKGNSRVRSANLAIVPLPPSHRHVCLLSSFDMLVYYMNCNATIIFVITV